MTRLYKHLTLLFFITLFVVCSSVSAQRYEENLCPRELLKGEVEGETVICGTLSVPELHSKRFGKRLELAVLTLKARSTSPLPDPILFLQGGPGGAALESIDYWRNLPWRDTRDIILIDQRGTGYSKPDLVCTEFYAAYDLLEAVEACRNRLSRMTNLQAYNSDENAADIALVSQALGYESINLYGVSYGTRLALTVMRDSPKTLRSVVLDSTYPPQVERLLETEVNFYEMLQHVFEDCKADEMCNTAYPDLEGDFIATLERLENIPARVWGDSIYLSGSDLLGVYFQAMYDEGIVAGVPLSMDKLSDSDYSDSLLILSGIAKPNELENSITLFARFLQTIIEIIQNQWRDVQAEGVFFSTECQEDVAFQSYTDVEEAVAELPDIFQTAALDQAQFMFDICKVWRVPRGKAIENAAVSSDIPTLVLAGKYDPVTSTKWGELASETLTRSYFYTFPNAAHGVFLSGDCPVIMVQAFLNNPETQPDSSCIDDIEMEFYVPPTN
ncbi:MAG: alpha/beta fold hydrolase [Trueperaceae bacterium]